MKPSLADRIGASINELDIDFSRFSIAGWIVSVVSLSAGGGLAYLACNAMVQRNGLDVAAGMVFCVTMIAVTTAAFLALRAVAERVGLSVMKPGSTAASSDAASRDTLKRMSDAGMDMTVPHKIEFWHLFSTKDGADTMAIEAKQMGFDSVYVGTSGDSSDYDVQVEVELVPTLSAIRETERTLASVAKKHHGAADGWSVKQNR